MNKTRITLEDTPMSILTKMSDGNPGASMVLLEMLSSNIDPDHVLGGLGSILFLDTLGIYGTDIHILNKYICSGDVTKTIAVLRAVQLGMFDGDVLKDACSRQDLLGVELVPTDELYKKVKERLPKFDV